MNYEIDSKDVIRMMLQFMKENNLVESMKCLSNESGILLNTVDSIEALKADINHGRWENVLQITNHLILPKDKLAALYEQIVFELLENNEREIARELIRNTDPLSYYKTEEPQRYLKLEYLCQKPYFNAADVYELISRDKRRYDLAESLASEVVVVPPSRLLATIGQALKYQHANGMLPKGASYDLFLGGRKLIAKDSDDRVAKQLIGQIKFTPESHPETAQFSPDGQSLATGSVDGFIEVWNYESCRLRKDLEYQAKDELMMHEGAVLCASYSREGDFLATGSQAGQLKVWKVSTGECMRKLLAHSMGITSVTFSKDNTQILTSSFDNLARIHGLKSGKTIKEFRGHTSFVNSSVYLKDGNNIMTASSDGTCKLWDVKTTEILLSIRPDAASAQSIINEITLLNLLPIPGSPEHMIVCTKGKVAYMITSGGQVIQSFKSDKYGDGGDFLSSTISPHGKWLYCVSEDGLMYVFNVKDGTIEEVVKVDEREVIGVFHHPKRNVIGTMNDQGVLKIWKA